MTTVQIQIPDDLAQDPRVAELLNSTTLEAWLRAKLTGNEAFARVMAAIDAAAPGGAMSPEDIEAEIRRTRRRRRA